MSQSPPSQTEALELFREASSRGLETRMIHPTDLGMLRTLEASSTRAN
jgi:hypothetical protein